MPIEHIVVLMLENRSFDNVLGGLYAPGNAPPYQTAPTGQSGLAGIPPGASNLGPTGPVYAHTQTSPSSTGPTSPAWAATAIPLVDPGEFFADMAQQLIGLESVPLSPPWSGYSPTGAGAAGGYVMNYAQIGGTGTRLFAAQPKPPEANHRDVMNYFTPAQLPVSAFLAHRYALSDTWLSSVPSQTYVNRSFALSAAPAVAGGISFIDDTQYFKPSVDLGNPPRVPIELMPTILSRLDERLGGPGATGPAWKVYFHDYSITYDTLQYVRDAVPKGATVAPNLGTFDGSDWPQSATDPPTQSPQQFGGQAIAMTTFMDDLQNGRLPPFSWIEPRYFDNWAPTALPPNSNHPGSGGKLFVSGSTAPIDAAAGEVLLMELYNLLRASPLWEKTLLIVTYDEAGGVWDHVPPPYAASPGPSVPPASYAVDLLGFGDPAAAGFTFNVFGARVPALVVSPLVTPGSLFRAQDPPFDHTSIIRTVRDVFLGPTGLTGATGPTSPPLNDRDAAAPSLVPFLTASPPNPTPCFEGTIVAGPRSLYFEHREYSTSPYPAPQTVFASAGPSYPVAASASPEWLSVAGPTGTAITVTADPKGLRAGSYYGQVTLFATGTGASASVPVEFLIKPPL